MKKIACLFVVWITYFSPAVFACGGRNDTYFEWALGFSFFCFVLCVLAIPSAAMLFNRSFSTSSTLITIFISTLSSITSLWFLLISDVKNANLFGIILLSISIAIPSIVYLVKAIMFRRQSVASRNPQNT